MSLVPVQESAVTKEPEESPNIWARAVGLVFLGFRVSWKPRLSDWEMNLRHAERWESLFTRWQISERVISLESPGMGYFVRLSDGLADFRCESSAAFAQALSQASEMAAILLKEHHARAVTGMEAQYLVGQEIAFEDLVRRLDGKLQKPDLLKAVNATLMDFAYLVDTLVDGVYYQINVGPVRAHEIADRVMAQTIKAIPRESLPNASLFVSIATRKPYKYGFDDLASYVERTINIGNAVIGELLS